MQHKLGEQGLEKVTARATKVICIEVTFEKSLEIMP